jgi:nitrogen regulatory protein PII
MEMKHWSLFVYIVSHRNGARVAKLAERYGISDVTVFMGHGTIDSSMLQFIGVSDIRKELVLTISKTEEGLSVMDKIVKDQRLDKPKNGIAFSLPITRVLGSFRKEPDTEEAQHIMNKYEAIFIIVDQGKGQKVIDTAKEAGAFGATLINGKGSGIKVDKLPFSMPVEPLKEIILILTQYCQTEEIVKQVEKEMELEKPGHGILFTVDVSRTVGLYEGNCEK